MSSNRQIIFWGSPDFAVPSLQVLNKLGLVKAVITQADKPAGRNRQLTGSPVKECANRHHLFLLQPIKLDDEFATKLKKFLPATFVIVAYGKIIPQNILDLSELPAINIHPSKLPELRGPSPIQTALLQGRKTTAVSLMQLDAKMDHGPILGQQEVKIEPSDDYLSLSHRLSQISAEILLETLPDYLDNKLKPKAQDDNQATFCKLIKKEDGNLDFAKTAEELHNQIRAFVDWPGSFAKLSDIDLKIIKVKETSIQLIPGKLAIQDKKLLVGTGTTALEIVELQPASKKILNAEEFIRGYQQKII